MFRKMFVLAMLFTAASASGAQAASLVAHRAIYDLVLDPEHPGTQVDKARRRLDQHAGSLIDHRMSRVDLHLAVEVLLRLAA